MGRNTPYEPLCHTMDHAQPGTRGLQIATLQTRWVNRHGNIATLAERLLKLSKGSIEEAG